MIVLAITYQLIASNTLTSNAGNVTFSNIPATYTDLAVRASVRSVISSPSDEFRVAFNGNISGTNYSVTRLIGDGSAATSERNSNAATTLTGFVNAATSTSNTFSSVEIYVPSYLATQNKAFSVDLASEQNGTIAYRTAAAGLWRVTDAITSVRMSLTGGNLLSGSSFFLYGLKSS